MQTARAVGQRSLCSRDRVGAVIVSAQNRIIDTGYNGPPAGWLVGSGNCDVWCDRAANAKTHPGSMKPDVRHLASDYSDCPSLHAEANALMFGDRDSRVGGSIYVSSTVCMGCAKLIANSGLLKVFYAKPEIDDSHRSPQRAMDFMMACGLWVTEL
jgi:dCMP deaminase